MTRLSPIVLAFALWAPAALAQPAPTPPAPPAPPVDSEEPAPPPSAPPAVDTEEPGSPPRQVALDAAGRHGGGHDHPQRRPEGRSLGLGFGWILPTDLTIPNTVAARFRLPSGLTFEPSVRLRFIGTWDESDFGGTTSEDRDRSLELELFTFVRLPLAARGGVDLVALGGAELGWSKRTVDPDGAANEQSVTTLDASLLWGLGLEWWFRHHFSLSFDATNPVVTYARSAQDTQTVDTSSSATTAGAIWEPTIRLTLHLYF